LSRLLLINCRPGQRRVAHIQDGLTTDLFLERTRDRGIVGNIYKGRVVRVLPGMQCAFLQVGLARTVFLYVSDVYRTDVQGVEIHAEAPSQQELEEQTLVPIEELLQQGQDLLVQVVKEPIGTKGARVTTQLGLPGRHLVFRPNTDHVGVSKRISEPEERERLKKIAASMKPAHGGLIVRTVGAGLSDSDFSVDLTFLTTLWESIQERAAQAQSPALLYEDLDLTLRSIRDLATEDLDRVLVDDEQEADRIRDFVARCMPEFKGNIEDWQGPDPLFERFGLEWEISRAVRRKVWLRSGGYLCIDRTEALTAIDVNTGRYVGEGNFEDTATKVNEEAAREIAYQLRFRDIGGLIVIDFIDMAIDEHREQVDKVLVDAMKEDRANTRILPMSELGLVEMTRKRARESIVQSLIEPCFYCDGRGYLRSIQVIVDSVLSRLRQLGSTGARGSLSVMAHPRVISSLSEQCEEELTLLQEEFSVEVQLVAQEQMHMEEVEIL
jgi:ribonuclease G